jgi:hypothetical protein
MPVLCKDCRFADQQPRASDWLCTHPSSLYQPAQNLVTGQTPAAWRMSCYSARLSESRDHCGLTGRYFESEPPRHPVPSEAA